MIIASSGHRVEPAVSPLDDFAPRLIAWQQGHGRHQLPWQLNRDPYRVWLSEIMLQQTQVDSVIPYFERFIARFPDLASLAAADTEAVMGLWSGLGYYARARNLHRCAQILMSEHGGEFPRQAAVLATLPGIGRSTAAAIAAFAFGERAAILDGNVKRVLCRLFAIEGHPGGSAVERRLWALADSLLPARSADMARYTQAQMDLGALVCTRSRPACARCPFVDDCLAFASGRTHSLPTPRPRKVLPARAARVAVIRHGDAVLLEQRPPSGLWGGLLSLPEVTDGSADAAGALQSWAEARFGLPLHAGSALPSLRHLFTHFSLELQPQLFEAAHARHARAAEAHWRWLPLSALADAALPTPIRRILSSLPPA